MSADADTDERRRLWKAAIKVPMYTVATTPVLVGVATAYSDTGLFSLPRFAAFFLSAVSVIAWLNVSNDVYDAATGIDKNKKESVVNLVGNTKRNVARLHALALAFLAVAAALFAFLGTGGHAGYDLTVLQIMAVCVFGGYTYQGPPFRLGYYGLGEPITLITWYLTVIAVYYSQLVPTLAPPSTGWHLLAHTFTRTPSALPFTAALVALPTGLILLCSHFHQVADDTRAGKRSPVVRMGTWLASRVVVVWCVGVWAVALVGVYSHRVPIACAATQLGAVPAAVDLGRFVVRNHAAPEKVRPAKYYAVKLHFIHGVLTAAGLVLSRWVGEKW